MSRDAQVPPPSLTCKRFTRTRAKETLRRPLPTLLLKVILRVHHKKSESLPLQLLASYWLLWEGDEALKAWRGGALRGCRGQSSAIQVCRCCRDGPMRKSRAVREQLHQLVSIERAIKSSTLIMKEQIHLDRRRKRRTPLGRARATLGMMQPEGRPR